MFSSQPRGSLLVPSSSGNVLLQLDKQSNAASLVPTVTKQRQERRGSAHRAPWGFEGVSALEWTAQAVCRGVEETQPAHSKLSILSGPIYSFSVYKLGLDNLESPLSPGILGRRSAVCLGLWDNLDNGYFEERSLISFHLPDRVKGKNRRPASGWIKV